VLAASPRPLEAEYEGLKTSIGAELKAPIKKRAQKKKASAGEGGGLSEV
jgi:hypothetical protein